MMEKFNSTTLGDESRHTVIRNIAEYFDSMPSSKNARTYCTTKINEFHFMMRSINCLDKKTRLYVAKLIANQFIADIYQSENEDILKSYMKCLILGIYRNNINTLIRYKK